jgi:xanthine dehydrogenase accessory factor
MSAELEAASAWAAQGHAVALGTVVRTWGSAPRQAGSLIAVRGDGLFAGSVSGGCVEGAVIEAALAAIADGKDRRLEFGVSDNQAWDVGLACGGRIEILVGPAPHDILKTLQDGAGRPLVRALGPHGLQRVIDPATDQSALGAASAQALRADRSGEVEIEGTGWFLEVHNPPLDLVLVGAVHIAQALARMALLADYRVRLIDPRPAFANETRFPGVTLIHAFPDEVLAQAPLGARSAVVVLAHDPKIDDPGLIAALKARPFYIGALGSKRTHAARLVRLAAAGFAEAELARIRGPVGLAIGARSPAEIAISILAQMTETLRT